MMRRGSFSLNFAADQCDDTCLFAFCPQQFGQVPDSDPRNFVFFSSYCDQSSFSRVGPSIPPKISWFAQNDIIQSTNPSLQLPVGLADMLQFLAQSCNGVALQRVLVFTDCSIPSRQSERRENSLGTVSCTHVHVVLGHVHVVVQQSWPIKESLGKPLNIKKDWRLSPYPTNTNLILHQYSQYIYKSSRAYWYTQL